MPQLYELLAIPLPNIREVEKTGVILANYRSNRIHFAL